MNNKQEETLMKPEKNNGVEPNLRFPEFRGAADWKFVPLNKLAKRCTQKNRGGAITRVLTNSAEYGVVDQRDYFDKDIATQGNLESYYVVEKGDYVYNPRISATAPVGPISKNNVATGVMSPLYTVFRFGNSKNDFYASYFKTTGWHQYMRQASSTGARHDRMAITNDDFMAMPLPASVPEEQQKIADCLFSIDVLIDLETKKINALKFYKNGLMQQLFPAKGEIKPRLRFPEFAETGDWEEHKLGDVCELYQPVTLSSSEITMTGEYLVYGANGVIGTHNEYNHADSEIAVTCRGATCGEVTRTQPMSWITGNAMVVRPRSARLAKDFVFQYFKNHGLKSVISGSAQPQITRAGFSPLPISFPTPSEQQRIADFLTNLDDFIAAEIRQLDMLKTHKKGLMQQLFPKIGEADV